MQGSELAGYFDRSPTRNEGKHLGNEFMQGLTLVKGLGMKIESILMNVKETGEYYSAIKRNEIELFVVRWMDLESVIHSEVSQKEKNKYRMLTHIWTLKKKRF